MPEELDLGAGIAASSEDNLKQVIKNVFTALENYKEEYLASIQERKDKFEVFISPGKSIREKSFSFFSILRKWNSYTPVLPQRGSQNKGGGYFVYHNGVGIVIDPGYNFIQNFFEQGFKLDDIDVVLITHAHNDHTVELESIFSLLYKRNKKKDAPYKKIDIYLNLGTFKKFAGYFDLSIKDYPNYIKNIVLLDSHNEYKIPKDNPKDITVTTTKTQHHEMITFSYALGFILKCGEVNIRFTSDTGWNKQVEENNSILMDSKQIDKIDILVPHLGTIIEEEFKFKFDKSIDENIAANVFYDNHLGILGSICMLHHSRPNVAIFSEFGEELSYIRKDIVKKISIATGIPCFPGDIGFSIKLDNFTVFCSKSGEMADFESISVFEVNQDLYYVSEDSFSVGEKANKQVSVEEMIKNNLTKKFIDLVK